MITGVLEIMFTCLHISMFSKRFAPEDLPFYDTIW